MSAYTGISVVSPVAAQRGFGQLYNPPASGVLILVDRIYVTDSNATQGGGDVRWHDSVFGAIGTLRDNGQNLIVGAAASAAQVREGNIAAGSLPVGANIIHEWWTGAIAWRQSPLVFPRPIVLRQGFGLTVAGANDNTAIVISWHFRQLIIG